MSRPGARDDRNGNVRVRPLRRNDWPVVEALFGPNGACGGCWCMWWRRPRGGKLWEETKGRRNKAAFKKLVAGGEVHGCVALSGTEPVGWCCIGPRSDFPRFERTRGLQGRGDGATWAVTCFFMRSGWRGKGVAGGLLDCAIELARKRGAAALEGYPVRPASDQPVPAAFAWTGVPRIFERAGFKNVTPPESPRPIYRLRLKDGS